MLQKAENDAVQKEQEAVQLKKHITDGDDNNFFSWFSSLPIS